eukprot:jgi/Hompol1/5829/HPOL_002379-RA
MGNLRTLQTFVFSNNPGLSGPLPSGFAGMPSSSSCSAAGTAVCLSTDHFGPNCGLFQNSTCPTQPQASNNSGPSSTTKLIYAAIAVGICIVFCVVPVLANLNYRKKKAARAAAERGQIDPQPAPVSSAPAYYSDNTAVYSASTAGTSSIYPPPASSNSKIYADASVVNVGSNAAPPPYNPNA